MANQTSSSHEISIKSLKDPTSNAPPLPMLKERKPDLNDKRKATLERLDNEKFGWFHVRVCLIAGIGFFTCAYDVFAINMVSAMLGYAYFSDNNNSVPNDLDVGLKTAATIGTLVGQIVFGVYADKLGRKRLYGIELLIVIVSTAGSTLVAQSFAVRYFLRVILGIGIGGDYPISAVFTSEFSNTSSRGAMIAAVFAMQGFGILFAALVSLLALMAMKPSIDKDILYLDYVWRIVLGIGIIPAVMGLYFRITIPESPRWTMDVQGNVEKGDRDVSNAFYYGYHVKDKDESKYIASTPKPTWKNFCNYFSISENFKVLVATSITWFVLDVAFYGIGLNHSIIYTAVNGNSDQSPYEALRGIAIGNAFSTLIGSVPGYWCSVFLIDRLGRKFIQLMGFAMLTLCYIVLGFAYQAINNTLFSILFTASMFFQNFGPNTTTFILPAELFPTRFRGTCHGIAAASGKLGAIIAQIGFLQMKDIGGPNKFMDHLLQICAFFTLTGFFFTFLIPETKRKSLEDNSNEEQSGFIKSKYLLQSKDTKIVINTSSKTYCSSPISSSSHPHTPRSPTSDMPLRPPTSKVGNYYNNNGAMYNNFGNRSSPEMTPNALPADYPNTSRMPPSYHSPVKVKFSEQP
ncbi:192_t:CDS:2 [Acaulospora morrowiae]|uniref:192_t:CDS:1 n=1 Tax=Acaulospora morrowiae TaxID=94023 RepID=A0A9N8Z3S7_9GLOM|nr:192_t:CDS:2 [Acaulospora morrowiae]